MAYDGIQNTAQVDLMTRRKLRAKVVDAYLASRTLQARFQANAKPFRGKYMEIIHDIAADDQFEYISGLEIGSPTRTDTVISTQYAHAAARQPRVTVMLDSFANDGEEQDISVDDFNYEKVYRDMAFRTGTDLYTNDGTGKKWHGLASIVDDTGTIGGKSRATYPALQAYVYDAPAGVFSLQALANVHNGTRASGMGNEEATIMVTAKEVTTFYEQLLTPTVVNSYRESGGFELPVRGYQMQPRTAPTIQAGTGFNAFSYRGIPMIEDDGSPTDEVLFLNERYIYWAGRNRVPKAWSGKIEKVSLGTPATTDGIALNMPTEYHGFFFQEDAIMPNQAGMVGWFYIIGQMICEKFDRQGKLDGITGLE